MKIAAIGFFIILVLILISFAVINLVRTIRYNDTSSESQELAEKARKTSASSEQKIDPILRSKRKKEQDMQYMREAGVAEDEISYTEIIYDTGDGYGGKLITYNFRNNQFYYHPYMWHIGDSQEFEESVPCSPEQAVSIIANCNHSSKSKIPSINRIAAISGIDVSVITLKKKTSEPLQQANSTEKTFSLLGGGRYGTNARMRRTDKGFEVIVEYHAPNPFEHFGTSAIVPSEIIGQMSLQALQNWMYTITTPAFHEEITAKEEEYRQFLRECGVTKQTTTEFKFTYSIGTAFEKIRNTAKEKFIYCLDFKESHHTIGHYRAFVDPRATIDLFFEQIDESGAIFDSGVIFAHWTITKNCDNSDAETKPERSDIYILTDSAYHNILDMLGAWKSL